MFARNVSFHLKSNMLSDYTRTFEKDILPCFASSTALRTRLRSPVRAESMSPPSVCGTTKPAQTPTTPMPTPKC